MEIIKKIGLNKAMKLLNLISNMEDAFKKTPNLLSHTVYAWVLDWSNYLNQKVLLRDVLCTLEQEKASQFLFSFDEEKYTVIRGLLRILIGRLLGRSPDKLVFGYNSFGKPKLLNASLEFNLSHSKNQVIYTFCKDAPLGVDIEYLDFNKKIDLLTKRYFSTQENNTLASLAKTSKKEAFFKGWVQKEAIVKALGFGLQIPLKSIEVSLESSPGHIALPYSIANDESPLQVYPIQAPEGFMSAVAIQTAHKNITFKQYNAVELFE